MEVIQGITDCRPEETGYDSSRLTTLNEHFERLMKKNMIVGAQYTISHKGNVIANSCFGGGSRISDKKMQTDTIFSTASITKPFTAVAIMQLVEKGYLRLDTKVGDILPQLSKPPFDEISVWNLLTHTSGIFPDGDYCYPDSAPLKAWDYIDMVSKNWDGKGEFDWIGAGLLGGIRKPVGARWMYSTFGFMILGEVITKVTGQFAPDYIEEHITQPLALKDTRFSITKDMVPRMYVKNERHQKTLDDIAAGIDHKEGEGSFWEKVPNTGGGLFSTTRDLVRFGDMMLQNGRIDDVCILGRKSVEKMTTYQLHNVMDDCWGAKEPDRQYGIGFDMRVGLCFNYSKGGYFHEGASGCALYIDPKEELCAAWFAPWEKNVVWAAEPVYNVQNIIWSGLI